MSERGAAALPPVGVPYDPLAEPLVAARARARRLTEAYNASRVDDADGRRALLRDLFGTIGPGALVEPPLRCDYGTNIRAGAQLFLNFDCVILDCAPVRFGDRVTVGPGVHFYAVDHPRTAAERATGVETAIPITVGDDVWIGGRAVIGPGVQVGPGAIVGAAAVVTRDVPAGAKVAGVPARVMGDA